MPKSKQRVRKDTGEVLPPSKKGDRIRELLKIQLLTFPQKELFPEEVEHWERDLDIFPLEAINWAFDNWRRSGHFFPVYDDIISQCRAWEPTEEVKYKPGCSAECLKRHNLGYNWNDMKILQELVRRRIEEGKRTIAQRLTGPEIDALLDEVDKIRGSSPAWRQQREMA